MPRGAKCDCSDTDPTHCANQAHSFATGKCKSPLSVFDLANARAVVTTRTRSRRSQGVKEIWHPAYNLGKQWDICDSLFDNLFRFRNLSWDILCGRSYYHYYNEAIAA